MVDDLGHSPGHLVRVKELLGVTSEVDQEIGCAGAEKQKDNMFKCVTDDPTETWFITFYSFNISLFRSLFMLLFVPLFHNVSVAE